MVPRKTKVFFIFIGLLVACTKDKGVMENGNNYPDEIAEIVVTKCAVSGCHNSISKEAAAGLSLASWKELFEGGRNGPCVIPYRPDFSTVCFYTNTFSDLGPSQQPTMPVGGNALSREDYTTLRNWIERGAPDKNGNISFSNRKNRKFYITNKLCDVVTVIDAGSKLPTRYISVGTKPSTEFPECVKVSPDNSFWLVSFFSPTGIVQKFNAETDQLSGQLELGPGNWSTFAISPSGDLGFFVDNSSAGRLAVADLRALRVLNVFSGGMKYPRGIVLNDLLKKAYVGSEYGNYVYVINYADTLNMLASIRTIEGGSVITEESSLDPHYFELAPDGEQCFISCEGSREIRVIDMRKDSLLKIISLPASPNMMTVSSFRNALFVSCPNDSLSSADQLGSVAVIDLNSLSVVKRINTGFQPFGLAVDETNGVIAVANANLNQKGPAPHHTTGCGGRNGYVTYIDLNTFDLMKGKKFELAVYPFSVSFRD